MLERFFYDCLECLRDFVIRLRGDVGYALQACDEHFSEAWCFGFGYGRFGSGLNLVIGMVILVMVLVLV